MPSADFRAAITRLAARSVRFAGHGRGPPEVSSDAFPAHPPNLPPRPLMTVDFAVIRPLVRPGRPRIRFLSIGSRLCSTLPSDPASRRRPCASLALRRHQAGQRTLTSKLPNMLGTRKYPPAKPGALRLGPLKGAKFRTFDDVPGIDGRRGTEDPLCRHCITACEGPTRAQNVWARLQESVFVI